MHRLELLTVAADDHGRATRYLTGPGMRRDSLGVCKEGCKIEVMNQQFQIPDTLQTGLIDTSALIILYTSLVLSAPFTKSKL
jgi:hypothetical protein